MTLLEYYLSYTEKLCEGLLPPPDGITLREEEPARRALELQGQVTAMGIPQFVRACAMAEGTEIPEEVYDNFDPDAFFSALLSMSKAQEAPEPPAPDPTPDPDKGKHAFEVFLDCINQDPSLVQYLIEVVKTENWKEFFKLSQITTKMDLDPREFLYWLGNKEQYADEEERNCVLLMDACAQRLMAEKQLELLAALLSGDQTTFELFRCEAPELLHVPEATFDWYSKNYLDRDYPLRCFMRFNGVEFPKTLQT